MGSNRSKYCAKLSCKKELNIKKRPWQYCCLRHSISPLLYKIRFILMNKYKEFKLRFDKDYQEYLKKVTIDV